MSVPSWKQTASKLDAFAEAVKLRHIITQMIMRNFGLKREKYDAIGGRRRRPDIVSKADTIKDPPDAER